MKRIFSTLILTLLMMIQAGTVSAATLYDDFGQAFIDKSIWLDHKTDGRYWHEVVREIDTTNQSLVLKVGTNQQQWPLRQGLRIPAENFDVNFTAIKADVKIVEVNIDATHPADSATVFARIGGIFYKASDVAYTTLRGDVWVELCIGYMAGSNQLQAWYEVEEFTSETTENPREWTHHSLISGLEAGKFYTLQIRYHDENQLTMTVHDGETELARHTYQNGPERKHAPWADSAVLDVCVHDNPGEYVDGYVHAEFDEVYINGGETAYDTFDGPVIDENKWKDRHQTDTLSWNKIDYVKESINGRARMHARGQNEDLASRLILRDRYTHYLEATAQIESGSHAPSSAESKGRVRIGGHFYNNKFGPGTYNGKEGDVFAQVGLQVKGNSRVARAVVSAYKADGTYERLFGQSFPTAIQLNREYELSLNYTGSSIVFQCNNNTITYDIDSDIIAPPSSSTRVVDSRLWLDSGENGFIKGQFDNVRVADPLYTNLTGTWTATTTNSEVVSGDCVQDSGDPIQVKLDQNNCRITITDDEGTRVAGVISGSHLLLQGSDIDKDGDHKVFKLDLSLANENSASGSVSVKSTGGCEKINTTTLTRSGSSNNDPSGGDTGGDTGGDSGGGGGSGSGSGSGGGGGCFLTSLLR